MPPHESDWAEIAYQRSIEKKSHVTFPQLKYPSLRDEGLRDPIQWLAGKAMDDGADGLWRVHDKLYDLTTFIDIHPGGAEWLELTKNTDITEAFETHHINPSTTSLLNTFYVRDAKTPRNSPFTFKEDGFYRTLKKVAYEELKKIPKSVTRGANMITDGLFITLVCTSTLAAWVTNEWAGWLCYYVASISLALLTVACHNYIHRRTNWRMYLFNMSMWSYRDFRVSHALSHHLYTNTLMDLELSSLEPVLYHYPRKHKPLHAKFGIVTEFFFFPFVFLITFTKRMILFFIRKDFFKHHFRWHDCLGVVLPLFMWLASGSPIFHVLKTWLWINCTGSCVFFFIGIHAAHHHPDATKDGDQSRMNLFLMALVSNLGSHFNEHDLTHHRTGETPDWGVHQVEALLDRKDINSNLFTVITMFGDHALHHLFPTLDHALLRYLHPVFLEQCEKFQANYRTSTQFKMVIGQIKECMRTEVKAVKN